MQAANPGRALIDSTHTVTNMRNHLVAIALGALAMSGVACSDIVGGYGSANITGTYELRTFNGSTLPTVAFSNAFEQRDILEETFTIYSDGTYTDDYTLRISNQSGQRTQIFRDTGTYQQNNTALSFRDSATGDVFNGSVTGNVLTVTYLGDVYVYQR
jgi:hypothetical protein